MIDGIIFDVDGTIWDSTYVVAKAWSEAFKEKGYDVEITDKTLKGLFGLPMMEIMNRLLPNADAKEKEELFPICSKYEMEYLLKTPGNVYEKMGETLEALSKKYPLGVVSNCQPGYIDLVFKMTGFGKYFKEQLCPGDTGKLKADNINIMADRLNMKNPIYVGDTETDEEATKAAGRIFVFAKYGFGKAKKPDYEISTPWELVDLVDKI